MPKEAFQPSDAELEILQILWAHAPASVRFVHEQLSQHKHVGYTTTLKQMQRMYEKGMLTRQTEGKSHLYTPVLEKDEVQKNLFERLVDAAFGGSAMNLVMHALGQADTSREELAQLMAFLENQKKEKEDE